MEKQNVANNAPISKKQMSAIEQSTRYIRDNIEKLEGPIFIELVGTPKSGKTTLLNSLSNFFQREKIPFEAKQETAEYNPIEDKNLEEYNIWMVMELMKHLSQDLSDKTPRVIIYDRGILDRLPWLDGSMPKRDSDIIKQLYSTDFVRKYQPLTYGFFTTPETSVQRKGKEGRLVNLKNVKLFNDYFLQELETIRQGSAKMDVIYTDMYQDRIKSFIMDTTEKITEDIRTVI